MKALVNLLLLIAFISIYSCAPLYAPNAINVPLFSEKGEIQANISGGRNGYDLMTAYSITDHLAVMLNGQYQNRTRENVNVSTKDYRQRTFGEAGFGYYMKLNEKTRFEAFGGGGLGNAASYVENGLTDVRANGEYSRFFIQPSIGKTSDIFDVAFSLRFGYVNLYNFNKEYQDLHFTPYTYLIEPMTTFRIGYKYVKFFIQVGASFHTEPHFYSSNIVPIVFNFGLNLNMGKYKKVEQPINLP
ncbi:MAG: hypothetical protein HXX09_06525 [Bacteroidetes bacterium]|nr:hypothetical protein [Bacteroidota bacterium]